MVHLLMELFSAEIRNGTSEGFSPNPILSGGGRRGGGGGWGGGGAEEKLPNYSIDKIYVRKYFHILPPPLSAIAIGNGASFGLLL